MLNSFGFNPLGAPHFGLIASLSFTVLRLSIRFPAVAEERAQTQLTCRVFGVVCLSQVCPRPHTVRSCLTTTELCVTKLKPSHTPWFFIVHLCFLTSTGRDQATSSRVSPYRRGNYYSPVRSPGPRIPRVHVVEVGRTVSLRDEVLPLTIFPDYPAFQYILRYAVVSGLHVRVRAYCWLLVFLKYMFMAALKFGKARSSHRGAEERWRWLRLLVVFAFRYVGRCPLVPVQPRSVELPATTEGEWRSRSSQGHKAGPLIVLLFLSTTHCCRVFFSVSLREVCNRTATTGVTGPNRTVIQAYS